MSFSRLRSTVFSLLARKAVRKFSYSEGVFPNADILIGTVSPVYALREIILSAGLIGTLTILQLSGIGPQAALKVVGIASVVDNLLVGQNLSDHALLVNTYNVKGSDSFDGIFRDPNLFSSTLNQWVSSFTGPFATGIANHIEFL